MIMASEILDLIVDTALSLDSLSQALHELQEPVNLLLEEVAQFIGALMCAMDVITSTSLVAECVSWDNTGEVRESLALSCRSLLSSICSEGVLSSSSSSVANPEVVLNLTGGPLGTPFTSNRSNRDNPPAPEIMSEASLLLTLTQAHQARHKKLAEARVWSQLSSND